MELLDRPSEIPIKRSYVAKFAVYGNNSDRDDVRYNYCLTMGDKTFSWLSRKMLPTTTGRIFSILRQPDMEPLSAGDETRLDADIVVIKSCDDNIKILIHNGLYSGVYSFIKKTPTSWIVVRNLDVKNERVGGPLFDTKKNNGVGVVVTVTSNKGLGILPLHGYGFSSAALGNRVPHISFSKSPVKFNGMVFGGELYLDGGSRGDLESMLSLNPVESVRAQSLRDCRVRLSLLSVLKLPKIDGAPTLSKHKQIEIIESFTKYVETDFIDTK